MHAREGRWWAAYIVRVTTVQPNVFGQPQVARAQTFHLPPDSDQPFEWRADAVITLDDVLVTGYGPTEDEALSSLAQEVKATWEARVAEQRSRPPTLRNHLGKPRPEDVHLNEPWLSIHWDPEHKAVHADFKGYATSPEFRASTMKILDAVKERHAAAMISDNRQLEGVSDEDQKWLNETWMPAAVDAGVRRIAVVLAHHGAGKVASEDIIRRFGATEFVTRTFQSLSDALAWVAQDG
jgi:hypothetical protein